MASKTALIAADLQYGILASVGDAADDKYLNKVSSTLQSARDGGLPIIHIIVAFRPGHPDISLSNAMMSGVKKHAGPTAFVEGDKTATSHHAIMDPSSSSSSSHPSTTKDIVVTKRRVGAFSDTDLALVLRSLGVNHIVLAGIATSGVILSTVRQAADMDFEITVLEDLCLDKDEEVHRVLMEKVFPIQATVTSSEAWLEGLGK